MKRFPITSSQIDTLVAVFYQRIRNHPELGPIFIKAIGTSDEAWRAHEARIASFWRNATGLDRSFSGNPMLKHLANQEVVPEQFSVWLDLFRSTAEETLPSATAAGISHACRPYRTQPVNGHSPDASQSWRAGADMMSGPKTPPAGRVGASDDATLMGGRDMALAETPESRRKARIVTEDPWSTIKVWLRRGIQDFRAHLSVSLSYGIGLVLLGWCALILLGISGLGWMILPALAGAMLLGPLATVGLYRISRRSKGHSDQGVAAPGQIFLVSVVMMVLALLWIRSATLLFAVFFGLRPFAGFVETLVTLFATSEGIVLFIVGSLIGGLFAALGFAVSAFSFPMLIDREIDGFSAMGLSFNATTQNFRLMVMWAACVTGLVAIGVLTGLLALIPLFPILGYATWHAYSDLFQE